MADIPIPIVWSIKISLLAIPVINWLKFSWDAKSIFNSGRPLARLLTL